VQEGLSKMANPNKQVADNVPGEFFVDTSCIDCDTCRQLAPAVFADAGPYSYVKQQPATADDERDALRALLACPTGSIGTLHRNRAKEVQADFPLRLEGDVYYCGYNSAKSFGGNSYFVRHPGGNWLIDSPKYLPQLVRRFEEWGGVAHIFLTHRDDVADAAQYAQRFQSRRIIHAAELEAQPDAECVLEGFEPRELAPGFVAIPTPGHTRGHCVLLSRNRFLFTGDHLDWDRARQRLDASHDYCWHSWTEQIASLARLLDFEFEWVLPGHGQRVHLPADRMRVELTVLVARLRAETFTQLGA
jgi:glyoxylase-like metal-dependent hydrolase (beta-lactamase superfamily II)/ferredoxin